MKSSENVQNKKKGGFPKQKLNADKSVSRKRKYVS